MRRSLATAAVAATASVVLIAPASADSEGCASMAEFNHMDSLLSVDTVEQLFDINGQFLGQGADDTFKRGYKSCWAPGVERVVVWFDDGSALSVRWAIRDV